MVDKKMRQMADLPDILCGPIVRAVDNSSVLLWLVTRHNSPIQASLSVPTQQVIEQSIQVGANTWIRRIQLLSATPFEEAQYIKYDVSISNQSLKTLAPHLL